jgi:hypothetical protein
LADCCEIVINNAWNKQNKTGIFVNNVGVNYTFNGKKCFIMSYIQQLLTVDMYT